MKRVWVVDDKIPLHELYGGPYPIRLDAGMVRHLVEQVPREAWEEPAVRDLCETLCGAEFEATFFLSPEAMLQAMKEGTTPPHAVIFDWEYPGSNDQKNVVALDRLLESSFAYVQVYTHLAEATVEPVLIPLRAHREGRLLPARAKTAVTPAQLAQEIRTAWEGTIAGEIADRVRANVVTAVERSLTDMCSVPSAGIAAIAQGRPENLVHLVLSRVRDELGADASDILADVPAATGEQASTEPLRRLMSAWYYFFPSDNRVRRGDLVEIEDGLGLVVTPACDLVKFPKKAGSRITWLRCVPLDGGGLAQLQNAGYRFDDVGNSIIAGHGKAGEALIVLPNVPVEPGQRGTLADYVLLCHAWGSKLIDDAPGGVATYDHLGGLKRRCTLADPFAGAVAARITAVISSPGTPDLPSGERSRLKQILASRAGAAGA